MAAKRHKKTQDARPIFFLALSCAFLRLTLPAFSDDVQPPALRLAIELSEQEDHQGAAIEFRRLALGSSRAAERGSYFWAAGHEYFKSSKYESVDRMLNGAEDEDASLKMPSLLLRGETARESRQWAAAAFYYDYKNLQVYTTVIDGAITRQLFTNASAARVYGAELELEARPGRYLTVSLNTALLNAKYRNFVSAGIDYSGNTLPSAPKVSVQGAVDWTHPTALGTIVANASIAFRSKVYFDTSNAERLTDPARAFVDGRLGIRVAGDRIELGVWGKNIFDETNISDMTPIPSLGFDLFSVGPPRTYGLYLKAHY